MCINTHYHTHIHTHAYIFLRKINPKNNIVYIMKSNNKLSQNKNGLWLLQYIKDSINEKQQHF